MSFDARDSAVQVSTALRTQLASVPGVRVATPRDIKEQLLRLRAEGITDDKAIRGLAARLGVDFVVWGSLAPDQPTVETAAYRRNDGKKIATIKLAKHSNKLAYALIQASAKNAPDDVALKQLFENMDQLQAQITQPMAKNAATHDDLLTALEALEQALAYEAGSDDSAELLDTADRASKKAISAEPKNALGHWLQANVAYNQASRHYRTGNAEEAKARMRDVRTSLGEAVKNRIGLEPQSLLIEIEADYYLNERQPEEAVKRYLELTKLDQPLQSQLRGHWMLAGIYAGDWGNAQKAIVDASESRRHITEILANWPDSAEAKLLKQWLRWDDTKEQTDFNYLPSLNTGLL
jgi:hypothetical protein